MTLAEYQKKADGQGGRCAVCHKPQAKLTRALCVDHNHKTGQVRGLLCGYCNHRLVGKYRLDTIWTVFRYLLRHEADDFALAEFDLRMASWNPNPNQED